MTNLAHQLLILGNGFNLNCGLTSQFQDFFGPRIEILKGAVSLKGEALTDYCSEKSLTAWDLNLLQRQELLEARGLNNWYDVESAIANVMWYRQESIAN